MKYWNDLDGSIFFNKVFSLPIAVGVVELFAISIDNNRPGITLEFDILEIPDVVPEKWARAEFNTCRTGIYCGNIQGLEIKNIPTKEKLDVYIHTLNGVHAVRLSNSDSLILFSTKYISLCGPSVYMNTD